MKKNFNVIQIKGIKGLLMAGLVVSCLGAGFIVFPGWVGMQLWNFAVQSFIGFPEIGLFQGVLLWGIIVASYFTFRKEKVVVCMRSPQGLSDEELKSVFADMKKHAQEDLIMQAMMKAREAEIRYKAQQELEKKESETANSDSSNV